MTVINACNVQIMNAYIGICRETNQIYIFQVLAHLLQNPLEITLFTFPAMRNPSRAVLFISKLATKSLLMLQRSRSQVPQQRPRPTNLTFWNWTAATQVEQKNHRRFDTIINEISVKHVARICYFMYVISAFRWISITFFSLIAMKLSFAQDMAAWVSSLKDHIARRLNANTMKTESIRFHTVHMNPASTS